MKLLIDTDAFCKLMVSELLHDAVRALGANLESCFRLPALPHMLRRGRVRRRYGAEACDSMVRLAMTLPTIPQPSAEWLGPLAAIQEIDPGEALIFATAAESGGTVVSGDKRALASLKDLQGHREALTGRVVVFEAVLLRLCHDLGADVVRHRVQPLETLDSVVRVCFSSQGSDPEEGLLSYFDDLRGAVSPLTLWDPPAGGGK